MNLLENKPGFVKWLTAGLGVVLLVYELCLLARTGEEQWKRPDGRLFLEVRAAIYMIVFGESMLSTTLVSGADGKNTEYCV